jgi:predicted transcriptional regulator
MDAFKDFQDQLQTLLAQFSALTINSVDKKADQLNEKMDKIIAAMNTLSPTERRMQEKIEDYGGEGEAFHVTTLDCCTRQILTTLIQNPRFLNEISSELGTKLTTQLTSILREDLDSQLESNK